MQVVIGIPAYNEEKNIAKIIVKLQNITNRKFISIKRALYSQVLFRKR